MAQHRNVNDMDMPLS